MLKRPFAVIGFSMLATFLLVTNISHKMTVALLIGATVSLFVFILFKRLRKYETLIFSLVGIISFALLFITSEKNFVNEQAFFETQQTIKGVVCQTPTNSDYAFTYIVKIEDENYKIRFVSEEDKFINEGDCVAVTVDNYDTAVETDFFENSLASKIYFTVFESDGSSIENTGKTNFFYKNIGAVKRAFSEIIDEYLPGENGAIAKAMTISDKSGIDSYTIDYFNYCGTSHLLVISGLHLTLWSLGIIKHLNKFSKLRKFSSLIGILCLLFYSAITGFTVSVLRAGAMIGAVLVARMFNRDADSINSIGVAVAFILIFNPFAPFSVSLWFTVLSTLGILYFSEKIFNLVDEKTINKTISKIPFYKTIITTISISFSTTVFTLPVFVFNFKMLPVASVLANLIMVDIAMFLMILTVAGVFSHLIFLYPVTRFCFFAVGAVGKFLRFIAEKIGMAEWSTISLNHKFYKYFLVLLLVGVIVVVSAKKYKRDVLKPVVVILSSVFILVSLYCTAYEYNTPSVEIAFTNSKPVIVANSKGKSVLVGTHGKVNNYKIKTVLNRHNKKSIDAVAVTDFESQTVSEIINLRNAFNVDVFYFYDDSPQFLSEYSKNNVEQIALGGNVVVNLENSGSCFEIMNDNKSILVLNCEKTENLFKNGQMYDIIILYGDNAPEYEKIMETLLKEDSGEVIIAQKNKTVSVYFERQGKLNGINL